MRHAFPFAVAAALLTSATARAQKAPEIGYVYPPGGQAGRTVDVTIGGYDWTPDMQVFVHDPRVKLTLVGPPGEVLVAPPPYWFGPKAFNPALPHPREIPARFEIPADMPAGPVAWQAANANGVTAVGQFIVGNVPEVLEQPAPGGQQLPSLPVTVSGRIYKIEEIDRYRFRTEKAGLTTCELAFKSIDAKWTALLEIRDAAGKVVAGTSETADRDTRLSFDAQAGGEYELRLHDVDFNGDISFVYRLSITQGPRILAAIPAAGRRGETRDVEFLGLGLLSGKATLERVTRSVTFPGDETATSHEVRLETPHGVAVTRLPVGRLNETIEPAMPLADGHPLVSATNITGHFERRNGDDSYSLTAKKGEIWKLAATASDIGSPVDPTLTIFAADGKQLATSDDVPGGLDAALDFKAPADGVYKVLVSDSAGVSGSPLALYRLTVERADDAPASFTLTVPPPASVALGGKLDLLIKAVRSGSWKEPIKLSFAGLPEGLTAPADAAIPADKAEMKVSLECAADAPAMASLVTITGTAQVGDQTIKHEVGPRVMANIMKPRSKVTPVDRDGGRTVHRGTTYPAAVTIERFEGYQGEVLLQMAAKQDRHRQGIRGPEMVVPAGVDRIEYPVTMPEWLETARTSRIVLIGVTKVADPRGNERWLVSPMDGRITMSLEGALLKLAHKAGEVVARPGGVIEVPLLISRSPKLPEAVKLELVVDSTAAFSADTIDVPADRSDAVLRVTAPMGIAGDHELTIRATALQYGKLPVVSQTTLTVTMAP